VLLANVNVQRYGARSILGWRRGYSVLREFGPLLTALVMTGRVGARNAAELASLSLGGQLEGLRGVGVDPFALPGRAQGGGQRARHRGAGALVQPRCGAECRRLRPALGRRRGPDVLPQLSPPCSAGGTWSLRTVKTVAFGTTISLVSTRCGLAARGGAQAVGHAAAQAVVASAAVLTALDWLLTLAMEPFL